MRGHQLILTLNPDCFANQGEMYQFSLVVTCLLTVFISMGAFLMMKVIMVRREKSCGTFKR
ncbi:hypothetical protein [Photorhabdus sp. RM157S]|uniref:hypothetical protein n=1 Tax=Photorhabdus TaxID=29487 RepID=UPI0009006589